MGRKTQSQKFADLIFSNPEFKEDVVSIRCRFSIPDEGHKNEEDAKKFFHELSEASLKTTQASEHITKGKKLQGDYYSGNMGRRMYLLKIRELESNIPQFQMDEAIRKLSIRHKISRHWDYLLLIHIITGEKHWAGGCVPGIFTVGDGPQNEVKITVDANCTLDDLKAIWPSIQEFQKQLYDYRGGKRLRKLKNLERDSFIVGLALKGLNYRQIVKEVSKKYKTVGYEYIPKILKRFKIKTGH